MNPVDTLTIASNFAQRIRCCDDFEQAISACYAALGIPQPQDADDRIALRIVRIVDAASGRQDVLNEALANQPGTGLLNRRGNAAEALHSPDPAIQSLLDQVHEGEGEAVELWPDMPCFGLADRSFDHFIEIDVVGQKLPAKVSCILDYPLNSPVMFDIELGEDSWSAKDICNAIADKYSAIYSNPEGYGIWGHDMLDLVIEGLQYIPDKNLIYAEIGS
jgi:hypothetical protein